jgi:hypothetical protein
MDYKAIYFAKKVNHGEWVMIIVNANNNKKVLLGKHLKITLIGLENRACMSHEPLPLTTRVVSVEYIKRNTSAVDKK